MDADDKAVFFGLDDGDWPEAMQIEHSGDVNVVTLPTLLIYDGDKLLGVVSPELEICEARREADVNA